MFLEDEASEKSLMTERIARLSCPKRSRIIRTRRRLGAKKSMVPKKRRGSDLLEKAGYIAVVYATCMLGCYLWLPNAGGLEDETGSSFSQASLPPSFLRKHVLTGWMAASPSSMHRVLRISSVRSKRLAVGQWPVTLRNQLDRFETLLHPANNRTRLQVPQFWSRVKPQEPLTRQQALDIGTCAKADKESGSYNRGDLCPLEERTIFVAIASYRDFQCRETIESLFMRASHPHRIRVAVVDQIVSGVDTPCNTPIHPCDTANESTQQQALCRFRDQIDVLEVPAHYSVGPVFARHLGHRMYRGEYYALQIDAHVTFVRDWDVQIIEQHESTKNEMAVLSTYLSGAENALDTEGRSMMETRPMMCNTNFTWDLYGYLEHDTQPEVGPVIRGSPQLHPWWAAGFSFSRGHFVVYVPYDPYQPFVFQGEEMSIAIRGFTVGYDFYAPEYSVCFHHYAEGAYAVRRSSVPSFWENGKDYTDEGEGIRKRSMARLLGIVHMLSSTMEDVWDHREADQYGLGTERTPELFFRLFGIDVEEKTIEGHQCPFIAWEGKFHKLVTPELRPDGMGIDYEKIDLSFRDPTPYQMDDFCASCRGSSSAMATAPQDDV